MMSLLYISSSFVSQNDQRYNTEAVYTVHVRMFAIDSNMKPLIVNQYNGDSRVAHDQHTAYIGPLYERIVPVMLFLASLIIRLMSSYALQPHEQTQCDVYSRRDTMR